MCVEEGSMLCRLTVRVSTAQDVGNVQDEEGYLPTRNYILHVASKLRVTNNNNVSNLGIKYVRNRE